MKKLYQYIIKSFLGTFVLTFFIVVFIWVMQFVWLYVDDLVGKGLEIKIIAELLFYTSITAIPMSLPLALLLALLMCFGNLGEHYELVAMKASGISMWRAMRPLLYFSLVLSVLAFFISNSLIPIATLKWRTLLTDVQRQKLAFNIKEGVFYKDIEGYVIYVERKGKDGSSIYGVKIYDHNDHNGNTKIISADSGMMTMSPNQRNIIFTLYNGHNYTDITTSDNYKETRPFERMSFKQEQLKFSLASFDMTRSSEDMYKSYQQMMNIRQLSASLDIKDNSNTDAEDVFSEIMLKVLPYVKNHPEDLTIAQLAKEAQMDMKDFYGVMSSNLYRTPRALVLRLRLQRVAELLRNSDKTVDEIAEDLNFESANYLIASFYHQYRQTPDDYRATNPR